MPMNYYARCPMDTNGLNMGKPFPYSFCMGKIFTGNGWILKVQGAEHPPVHIHLLHPSGKAVMFLDGTAINSGVPSRIIAEAAAWVPITGPLSWLHGRQWEIPKRGKI